MCRALESHVAVSKGKQEKIIRLDSSLYALRPSTNFSLTLKAYWDAKGLSARLFESSTQRDNATYMIKGPMGKSLGVKRSG